MVSKYSTGIPILQPIESVDTNLLYTSLSKKQDQYDKGFLAVQGQLDKLASTTDLVRKEDIDMFRNKMQSKVESFNQLGNVDLSDIKLASSLASDVQSIANDSDIKDAVLSTIEYKKLVKGWDDIQKNPKAMQYYNPINHQYDIENKVMPWMSGQVKSFRDGNPTLFYNMNEDLRKTFEKVKGQATPTTDGQYMYNGRTVSAETLQKIAYDQMLTDTRYQKQMEVNSWYETKTKTPTQIAERALSINAQLENTISKELTKIGNEKLFYMSQNKDVSEYNLLLKQNEDKLLQLKEQKTKLLSGNFDVKQLSMENQRDGLLDYASQFAWSDTKITSDPYGVLAKKQAFDKSKYESELGFDKYKFKMEYEQKERLALLTKTAKTGQLPENGLPVFDSLGMKPTGMSFGTDPTGQNIDYIEKHNVEVQETVKRANGYIANAVATVLRKAGLDTAADEILTLSPNEMTKYIQKNIKYDKKGVEVRKMYNQIRQKYDDVRDGKDDGAYFIDNPDIAADMKNAQKEFMILADLDKNFRIAEEQALKEKGINVKDYKSKTYNPDLSYAAYEKAIVGTDNPYNYEQWKESQKKNIPYYDVRKEISQKLAASKTGATVFGTYIPNKELMKSEDGGRVWGELTNMIAADAAQKGVTLIGEEGSSALWGTQMGKEALKNAEDLKNAEIEDVLQIDGQGLAKVKFKTGDDNKETKIGFVQLSPDNAKRFVGTKNTDRRFSEIIKANGATSGALNTYTKGIMVPYTIGWDKNKNMFYATIRRGANPRVSGIYADSAEAIEEMVELRVRQVYEKLVANQIPKEKWVDYTAETLATSTSN